MCVGCVQGKLGYVHPTHKLCVLLCCWGLVQVRVHHSRSTFSAGDRQTDRHWSLTRSHHGSPVVPVLETGLCTWPGRQPARWAVSLPSSLPTLNLIKCDGWTGQVDQGPLSRQKGDTDGHLWWRRGPSFHATQHCSVQVTRSLSRVCLLPTMAIVGCLHCGDGALQSCDTSLEGTKRGVTSPHEEKHLG